MSFIVSILFLFTVAIISLCFIASSQMSQIAPGLAWKVKYVNFPELQCIYDKFAQSCVIPDIPQRFFENTRKNIVWQQMRQETETMEWATLESKYAKFETSAMKESPWALDIREFYGDQYIIKNPVRKDLDAMFSAEPIDISRKKCEYVPRDEEYKPRLGCYQRHISEELEIFATRKIQALMERLQLPNKLEKLTDSRGASYMAPGGFMECHTNRLHIAGWRLYMHVIPEGGSSTFVYRHCFDKSLHVIPDMNQGANMFRIRKLPDSLLWHAIYSDTHRFSWGLWIPPELAQFLKLDALRM